MQPICKICGGRCSTSNMNDLGCQRHVTGSCVTKKHNDDFQHRFLLALASPKLVAQVCLRLDLGVFTNGGALQTPYFPLRSWYIPLVDDYPPC